MSRVVSAVAVVFSLMLDPQSTLVSTLMSQPCDGALILEECNWQATNAGKVRPVLVMVGALGCLLSSKQARFVAGSLLDGFAHYHLLRWLCT
jgi:hypothetical protein